MKTNERLYNKVDLMRTLRLFTGFAAFAFFVHFASAQMFEQREIEGKTIWCTHSGLFSNLKDCAGKTNWYAYVFVGSISSIRPVEKDEKEIQVVPEEIFYGSPESPTTVLTSQGQCLPPIIVGDRWLFFLRKEKDKPILLDFYGNDSRPVADAQEEIETLRRLQSIGEFALLRGAVNRGNSFGAEIVPNATVIARRKSDAAQFLVTSDSQGRYEFQPLAPGDYRITVMPNAGYQPDESGITLKSGACWDLTLTRSPHAAIGGHVKRFDGSPAPNVDVVITSSNNEWYEVTQTDKNGYFQFESQAAGEFVVGLNFPARPDWFNGSGAGSGVKIPPASLFYPGVASRSSAGIIKLATDEKRENVDFVIPIQ
jgi:hypothetical protein